MIRVTSLPHSGSLSQLGSEVVVRTAKIFRALANRLAVRELAHCDERMLKDIGLSRSDVLAALDASIVDDPSVRLRRLAAGRGRI